MARSSPPSSPRPQPRTTGPKLAKSPRRVIPSRTRKPNHDQVRQSWIPNPPAPDQEATSVQEGIVVHALAILTEAKTLTAGTSNDAVVPGLDEVFSALQMLLLKIQAKRVEIDGTITLKAHIGELSSTIQEVQIRKQALWRKRMEGLIDTLQRLDQPGNWANLHFEPLQFFNGDPDTHELKAVVKEINKSISVFLKTLTRTVRFALPEIDRYTWVLIPLASVSEPFRGAPRQSVGGQRPGTSIPDPEENHSTPTTPASPVQPYSHTITVTSDVVKLVLDVWVRWLRCQLWEPGPTHKTVRSSLVRARLLSREYDDFLRPRILSQLRLSSTADIRVLLKMLRSGDRHGRLSQAVKYLELLDDGSGLVDFERSCKLLAGKLPSLKELGYNLLRTDEKNPSPMTPLPSRVILASFTKLRVFSLLGAKILSFSVLARALGALPKLKQVALHRVEWVHEEYTNGPAVCQVASFSSLRLVIADHVVAWPLIHLWAPMLESRYGTTSEGNNTDATSLSSLMKICCDSSSTTRMVIRYDPASDSFHASSYIAVPHWAFEISLLPSGAPSVIRSIQLRVADPKFFLESPPTSDWKEVDHRLGQFAKNLNRFTIYIDPNYIESEVLLQSLPQSFPELGEGIVSVKLVPWGGPGDDFGSME